jgi:hypothetical protein
MSGFVRFPHSHVMIPGQTDFVEKGFARLGVPG